MLRLVHPSSRVVALFLPCASYYHYIGSLLPTVVAVHARFLFSSPSLSSRSLSPFRRARMVAWI